MNTFLRHALGRYSLPDLFKEKKWKSPLIGNAL